MDYKENANILQLILISLVVERGFNSALAKEYIRIANGMGPEYKIFSDLDSAEEWIART